MLLVTGRVPEMEYSGIRNQPKNGSNGKLNKAFLTFFCQNVGIVFDDLSKFYSTFNALDYFEKSTNMPKF